MPAKKSATILFCDDVRNEVGGKITIVGLYRGFMAVHEATPFVPKVVALVAFQYPPADQGSVVKVRLLDRGSTLVEAEFMLQGGPQWAPEIAASGAGDTVYMNIPMELNGYPAPDGACLTAVIEVGDFECVSDELKVIRVKGAPDNGHSQVLLQ